MSKTQKSIVTEIWELKNKGQAENGNTILEIDNRRTGKIETFQKIREDVDKRFTLDAALDENADSIDTEDYYGCNGYNRARYAEEVIARQTVDAEEYIEACQNIDRS